MFNLLSFIHMDVEILEMLRYHLNLQYIERPFHHTVILAQILFIVSLLWLITTLQVLCHCQENFFSTPKRQHGIDHLLIFAYSTTVTVVSVKNQLNRSETHP